MHTLAKLKWYILAVLLVIGVGVLAFFIIHKNSPIPPNIKKQTNFVIFYPQNDSGAIVDKTTFKYDSSSKVLSFVANEGPVSLTFGEQSTPQGFVDIPQAYDKLIESLNGYASFGSYYGKVDLTHPKEFNGQQSAAMNAKGTLMFVHPTNGSLTTDQWKQFFNNLQIIQ